MKRILILTCCLFLSAIFISCSSSSVSRLSADEVTDLSGKWNDTDSRLVSEKMISSLNSVEFIRDYLIENERKPVVIVGIVRNMTSEHINTNTFIKDIEREIVRSRWLRFVASKIEREEIRDERLEQQIYASEETVKKMLSETGADFMLRGDINLITDKLDGEKIKYFQVNLELVNIESNEKVWVESQKIKKLIEQDSYRF